jgi:uncharacterized protein
MTIKISIDRKRLADVCRRRNIRRMALFGSVLRDDFRPDSDVDVLVEFTPGKVPGLEFFDIGRRSQQCWEGKQISSRLAS